MQRFSTDKRKRGNEHLACLMLDSDSSFSVPDASYLTNGQWLHNISWKSKRMGTRQIWPSLWKKLQQQQQQQI